MDSNDLVVISRQVGSDPPVLVESFAVDGVGNTSSRTDEITEQTISYYWDDSDKVIRVSCDIHRPVQDNCYDAGAVRKRKRDKNGNNSREFTLSSLRKIDIVHWRSTNSWFSQGLQFASQLSSLNGN